MAKKAVLVGINYPGTMAELRGCINDVNYTSLMLTHQFGFKNIKTLIDAQATTKNILANLNWLVNGSKPGDILYFHYSGHGSQTVDQNRDEPDRLDEILCPVDLNWKDKIIRDDDLAMIFSKVHPKANLTVILDCCHSGDGIRGGLVDPNSKIDKSRWIPTPQTIIESATKQKLLQNPRALKKMTSPKKKGILISGCKSNQTSADAWIETEQKYMGACTYFLTEILKKHNYKLTYKQLVSNMNRLLKQAGYSQMPQLHCLSGYPNLQFLSPLK